MSDDGHFECPECGNDQFSWTITDVAFGPIIAYDVDDDDETGESGTKDFVATDNGPVVEADTDPVMCAGCDEEFSPDDLIFVPHDDE